MASSTRVTAFSAASALKGDPKRIHPGATTLQAWDDGWAYLFFSPPFPRGATILYAAFAVHTADTFLSTSNIVLEPITQAWGINSLTWNNKPAVGPDIFNAGVFAKANTQLAFDVRTQMQAVANGGTWLGFRFRTTHNNLKRIWSESAPNAAMRPFIDIVWSTAPYQPGGLSPNGGQVVNTQTPTLVWGFTDPDGDTSMAGFEVNAADNAAMTLNLRGSGDVNATAPILNWGQYPALGLVGEGSTVYWRVRNRDDSGLWSPWSGVAYFKRVGKGTVTIDSPLDASVVHYPSPVIDWTFTPPSGYSQAQWRIYVTDMEENYRIYDTGTVVGTEDSFQLPYNLLTKEDVPYKITLRILDSYPDRATVGGDSAWVEKSVTVTYDAEGTGSILPITDLTVSGSEGTPTWTLDWTTSQTAVDYFIIYRTSSATGETIPLKTVVAGEVLVEGSTGVYQFKDNFVPGRANYTWQVQTVSNNDTSWSNSVTATVRNIFAWMIPSDENEVDRRIPLANASIDPALTEISDLIDPVDGPAILVVQKYGGLGGSCEALLTNDIHTKTAPQMKVDYLWMRRSPRVYLLWSDEVIECYIYNCTYSPISRPTGKTDYSIKFNFIQVVPND